MATEATKAIEAILMVAQEPVDPHLLAQLLEVSPARVDELCHELQVAYLHDDRGFVLVKVAGGYRFQSHADMAPYVERFVLEGQTARLSSAALETLAIVAYKQPISRAQVAAVRGVNVDGVMRTLQQRGYIDEVGRDPGPGQATLFGTTREFLERLGLDSLHDLPPLADLFPNADVLEALELGLRAEPAPPSADRTADPDDAAAATTGNGANDADAVSPSGPDGGDHAGERDPAAELDPDDASDHDDPPPDDEPVADGPPSDGPPALDEPELPAWFTEPDTEPEPDPATLESDAPAGVDPPEEPTPDDRT